MTDRLETVLEKVSTVPNPVNSSLMQDFYQFMVYTRKSVAIRRITMSRHSFTSHRSLRPAYCILLRVISTLMKRQTWQPQYQGPLLVMQTHCKLVVWLHVYVLLSVDIRQDFACPDHMGSLKPFLQRMGLIPLVVERMDPPLRYVV
jgi:hypothetical protein